VVVEEVVVRNYYDEKKLLREAQKFTLTGYVHALLVEE